MVVGIASTAFLILATFAIQPELRLPTWLLGILSPIILSEYVSFLTLLHRNTLDIYDKSPCGMRLGILRVSKTRNITFLGFISAGFALTALGLLNVAFPLPAALPYYAATNIYYLTRFRIPADKELHTAFESLSELSTLSRFYQSMALGIIGDKVEHTVKKSLPLAKKVDTNPILRALYIGYTVPSQTSTIEPEVSKLEDELSKESKDVYETASRVSKLIPEMYRNAGLSFQLPWESKVNWGLFVAVVFGMIDATGTIFILQNAGLFAFLFRALTGK